MPEIERRTFGFGVEAPDGEAPTTLRGHAAVFGQETRILWFREKIAPGAFEESIKGDDIRALWNHDPNFVLGRNTAGTLTLREDEHGLAVEISTPQTQIIRDLVVEPIRRGDVSQMSFGFQTVADKWERDAEGEEIRTILSAKLWDVSPVTFPAYEGTDVAARSHEAWTKQESQTPEPAPDVENTPDIQPAFKDHIWRR